MVVERASQRVDVAVQLVGRLREVSEDLLVVVEAGFEPSADGLDGVAYVVGGRLVRSRAEVRVVVVGERFLVDLAFYLDDASAHVVDSLVQFVLQRVDPPANVGDALGERGRLGRPVERREDVRVLVDETVRDDRPDEYLLRIRVERHRLRGDPIPEVVRERLGPFPCHCQCVVRGSRLKYCRRSGLSGFETGLGADPERRWLDTESGVNGSCARR